MTHELVEEARTNEDIKEFVTQRFVELAQIALKREGSIVAMIPAGGIEWIR
jgi:hypothetical protein